MVLLEMSIVPMGVGESVSLYVAECVDLIDSRCFFDITNDWEAAVEDIVFDANGRCQQENLIQQHKKRYKCSLD